MHRQTVIEKLSYAQDRIDRIFELSRLEVFFDDFETRQRVTQEFFFHLSGTIDYLLLLINNQLELEIRKDLFTTTRVKDRLAELFNEHELEPIIELFSVDHKNLSILDDPYSDTGMMYRIKNYRNRVAHRGMNPYNIVMANDINAFMYIDPEFPELGNSEVGFLADLSAMFELVSTNIHLALDILDR